MKKINIDEWKRAEHFRFFSTFDEPFLGVVSEVDCTHAYQLTKKEGYSFFAWYLHKTLVAVNMLEEFKTRIEGDDVILFDTIHVSATIGREDGTFGFSFVRFNSDFNIFQEELKAEISEVKATKGLRLTSNSSRKDVIHASSLPWYKVTGVSHPRNFGTDESVPKISYGKYYEKDERLYMAVSVNMHHGLADGKQVGEFLELFQSAMNKP